ncbi:cytochrome P460 family protein [Marinobacter sp.]|uniref:cytochrome P460 family protein n=1 Tax=Marinobacter sp. TaxID=50741 RepID=UPI001B6344E5|nr:cytochrome P460 family protein [Marinobacter sp.]MBQ0832648.1 cytochrome P460 family protein [Marinobacter sp.]
MRFKTTLTITLTALLAGTTPWVSAASDEMQDSMAAAKSGEFSPYVDAKGTISRPPAFRDKWVHIGSWFVREDDQASGPGVHDVYADPAAVEGFRKTGQWTDGATLVKEISSIREGQKTTGFAQWAGEAGVWFVMVRDRENRFPENAAWGEGWGWALFTTESPETTTTKNFKGEGFNNCFGCHIPAKDTEWVFIEGYPAIRDSANYGK